MKTDNIDNTVLRSCLSITAVSYGIGVLIVNLHYSQWGYFSFELLKIQYVTAGLWAIATLVIVFVIWLFSFLITERIRTLTRKIQIKNRLAKFIINDSEEIIGFLVGVGISLGILSIIATGIKIELHWTQIPLLALMVLFTPLVLTFDSTSEEEKISSLNNLILKLKYVAPEVPLIRLFLTIPTETIKYSFILIFVVVGISQIIYGSIPLSIGGGLPEKVEIIFSDNKLSYAVRLGLVDLESPNKIQLYLLTDSSNGLVLITDKLSKGHAVEVKKNFIEGIIYRKSNG